MFGFNISGRLLLLTDLTLGQSCDQLVQNTQEKKKVSVALWQYKSK